MEQDRNLEQELIYCYSRKQALEDGIQVAVSETAKEAGIRYPVFITGTVYERCVAVPDGMSGQDEAGRLWDVLTMFRWAAAKEHEHQTMFCFKLYVRNQDDQPPRLVELVAACGALDFDDPQPAITIFFPEDE